MPRRKHYFVSKAQWRAMHARKGHRGWVRRWTHTNRRKRPWATLPRHVRGSRRRRRR